MKIIKVDIVHNPFLTHRIRPVPKSKFMGIVVGVLFAG